MEAQRREAAVPQSPGAEVGVGQGAFEGAATSPQAPGRGGAVPGRGRAGPNGLRDVAHHHRQGEEGAGLVEGGAERRGADAVADEVEEVAVLSGGGIGPLAGRPRGAEAHVEGAPAGAVEVAGDPVAALSASVGEVAPAHRLGGSGQGGGESRGGAGVHGVGPSPFQSHPRSANETVSPSPTTRWSRTRTPTVERAPTRRSVMARSRRLGSATPEGWLWARMTAAVVVCRR